MAKVSRKSDGIIVPKKQPNKERAAAVSAEVVEERVRKRMHDKVQDVGTW